jgi:hypothetical protein
VWRFTKITEWEAVCHGFPNVEEQHTHRGALMEPEMETQVSSVSGSSSIALSTENELTMDVDS